MALTQISTQGIKDGTITGSDLATNIDLVDNQKLRLGTGNDLQIYHDGSNSFISDAGTGGLKILGSAVYIKNVNDHDMVEALSGGAVSLFHNNSKKFETYANGFRAANNGHIKLASDSGKFFMGAGDDAELFHDGTNLTLNGDGTNSTFLRAKSGENSIVLIPDAAVELYHDNTLRFSTNNFDNSGNRFYGALSGGDSVPIYLGNSNDLTLLHDGTDCRIRYNHTVGELKFQLNNNNTVASFNTNGHFVPGSNNTYDLGTSSLRYRSIFASNALDMVDNAKVQLGNSDDLQIYHDGTNNYIDGSTGYLFIRGDGTNSVHIKPKSNEESIVAKPDGAVELYYDNSKMLETTSAGVTLVGEANFTSQSLKIRNWGLVAAYKGLFHTNHGASTHEFIIINNETHTKIGTGSGGNIQLEVGGNSEDAINCYHNGAVELYYDNSKKCETRSDGLGIEGDSTFQTGSRHKFIGGSSSNLELGTYSSSNSSRDVHMSINSAGNVGIGTSSPSVKTQISVSNTTAYSASTVDANQFQLSVTNTGANGVAGILLATEPSSGNGGHCGIRALSTGNGDSALTFSTRGNSTQAERMRINSDGDVFVGTTTTNPGFGTNSDPGHYINHVGYAMHSRDNGTALFIARNDNTGSLVSFNYTGGGQIADISTNGSSVSYNTGSDYRLKENITTLTNAITRLKKLKPSRFNFLTTPSITQDGFIAHEVQEVVPEAVTGVKDEVRTEDGDMGEKTGDPVMQSLDVAKLVPLLTAGLQEAISKIELLETEVAALKAG